MKKLIRMETILGLLLILEYSKGLGFSIYPIIFLTVILLFQMYDLSKLGHNKKMIIIASSAGFSSWIAILWITLEILEFYIGKITNKNIKEVYKQKVYKVEVNDGNYSYTFVITRNDIIRSYKKYNPISKNETDKDYKKRIKNAKNLIKKDM